MEDAPPEERTLIAGLMQRYLDERSSFTGQKAQGNGRYRYPTLDTYWNEANKHAFLIRLDRRVIGFALVREVAGGTVMAEFSVSGDYRRSGHGRRSAHEIFKQFPGKWAVQEPLTDSVAQSFWRNVIKDVDPKYSERIETGADGNSRTVQRFHV